MSCQLIGTVLNGRYRLDERLGAGGMGTVYRATDLEGGRPVAVKFLLDVLEGEEHHHRFQREFRILTHLSHPRVVAVYDYGHVDGRPYYVMELLGGTDLVTYRLDHGGRLPEDEIRALATQLCQGLSYIHAEGLIHRDLKPGNIRLIGAGGCLPASLAGDDWTLKLMDFGLARPHDTSAPLTASGALLGTVNYMAPEQAQGQPLDPRADLYALGVILYELATGRLPFSGDSPVAILLGHIQSLPVLPTVFEPELSPGLAEVIMGLLAKRPADRPATAADVLAALRATDEQPTDLTRLVTAAAPRAHLVFRAHLIGRDAELARLSALLDAAWQRQGGLVLVEGEAGVGKTRLVRELADQVRLRGGRVLWGACYEGERLPYGPFVEALRSLLDGEGRADPQGLLDGLESQLRPLFPGLEGAGQAESLPPPEPDQARLRLFDATVRLLGRLAERQPLVLVLDDLHWADDASLELLAYLVRNCRSLPLLLCGGARREERDEQHPLTRLVWALSRQRLVERLELAPLPPPAAGDLLAALLGLSAPPEPLAAAILHHAEGNPFFVEELVKMLAEEGRLERQAGRWRLVADTTTASLEALWPPPTIRDLIGRRLGVLPPAVRDVLQRAAVLGREFTFDVLLAIDGLTENELLDAISELLRARLVEEIRDPRQDRYRFVHGMIQEVIYGDLPRRQRRRLHLAAGQALEHYTADGLELVAGQLARHFAEGGDTARAVTYGRQAADRARQLYANQEAIHAYSLALAAIDGLPEAERPAWRQQQLALEDGLGDVLLLIGEYEQAAAHLRSRLALLQAGPADPEALATTWHKLAASHRYRGQYAEAILSLEWALGALGTEARTPALRAALLLDLGWIAVRQGRHADAIDLGRQALDLAGAAGDAATLAGAYDCLGMVARYQGDYPAAIDHYRRSLALKESLGDKGGIARTLNNLGIFYEEQEDYDQARGCYGRALALSEQTGHRLGQALLYNNLGLIDFSLGNHPAAVANYRRALALCEQIGHLTGIIMAHNNLGEVYHALGDYAQALEHLRQAETLATELGEQERLLNTVGVLAEVYSSLGDTAAAGGYARRALELARQAGMRLAEEEAGERLARMLIQEGDVAEAQEHLRRALELSQSAGHRDLAAKIQATLAKLQNPRS